MNRVVVISLYDLIKNMILNNISEYFISIKV